MPIVRVLASINTNYRTKTGFTDIITVLPFGSGLSPNGNTLVISEFFARNVLTIRNIRNLFVIGATDLLYWDYFDNPNMLIDGFPLAPGEAFDVESPESIYASSATINNIPVAIDEESY